MSREVEFSPANTFPLKVVETTKCYGSDKAIEETVELQFREIQNGLVEVSIFILRLFPSGSIREQVSSCCLPKSGIIKFAGTLNGGKDERQN